MLHDIKVTLELNNVESACARILLEELIDMGAFEKLPYDAYLVLEKLASAVDQAKREQQDKFQKDYLLANKERWKSDRCSLCGHTAWDHSGDGKGLCCAESCTHCFAFKK